MEKTEVYNYLAKIYFDKKAAEQKKPAIKTGRYLFFLSAALIIFLIYLVINYSLNLIRPKSYSLYLATGTNLVKISYNFADPTLQRQGYIIGLENLDAGNFQELQFNARCQKKDKRQPLQLRVEIENTRNENAHIYLQDIAEMWRGFKIDLNEFKGISSWRSLKSISFIVEEWNTQEKKSNIYIDNIRFTKKG